MLQSLNQSVEIKQSQKQSLVLTPELVQAIRILQYNTQELEIFIGEQLLANPVLEIDADFDRGIESEDNALQSETGEKTEEFEDFDWQEYLDQRGYDDISYSADPAVRSEAKAVYGTQGAPDSHDVSLSEHLMFQLQFQKMRPTELTAARYIIESLDDAGYMTQSISEIAGSLRMSLNVIKTAFETIRSFDPTGVGAEDLSDCLTLQLNEKGLKNPGLKNLIAEDLESLAANNLAGLSKKHGIKLKELRRISETLRYLEPKPGRLFSDGRDTTYIIPDVYVTKNGDDYEISVNDSGIPHLYISSFYRRVLSKKDEEPELVRFLSGRMDAAIRLIKSIEHRKKTIYNVVSAIVDYQKEFFDKGTRYMKPLTLKKIADTVGIHESTVSRAVSGKYLQSPQGLYELKYFLGSGIPGAGPEGIAAEGIKARIGDMIGSEDRDSPLSDRAVSDLLRNEGINISRRTVAKYRDEMGVLPSSLRKKFGV